MTKILKLISGKIMMIMIIIMFCTNYMDVNLKPLMMI